MTADQTLVAYDYLECRTMGHAWSYRFWGPIDEMDVEAPQIARAWKWSKVRITQCLRCECVRDEFYPANTINQRDTWRVMVRRYRYPKGYQRRGPERRDREEYTAAAYERWTTDGV